jgi:hypothetical protein
MKIDFAAPIRNITGEPIVEGGSPVTLGSIACNALLKPYDDEKNLSGADKVKRTPPSSR